MLHELEMHDIQDKTRLLDEMNETREAVNELEKKVSKLMRTPEGMRKPESKVAKR